MKNKIITTKGFALVNTDGNFIEMVDTDLTEKHFTGLVENHFCCDWEDLKGRYRIIEVEIRGVNDEQ